MSQDFGFFVQTSFSNNTVSTESPGEHEGKQTQQKTDNHEKKEPGKVISQRFDYEEIQRIAYPGDDIDVLYAEYG
jgi:hypothetical protein